MLTKKETVFIDGAVRSTRDAFRILPRDNSTGMQIGAVRWLISENSHSDTLVRTGQIALCKLIEMNPAAGVEYIVQRDRTVFVHPTLSRLLTGYGRLFGSSGPGTWAIQSHEQALFGIYVLANGMWNTTLIHRASLRALLTAYEKQEALSNVVTPGTDVRAKLAADIVEQNTTSNDRKRAARDVFGTCYNCTAPKPRGSQCLVCGYTPRGGAR